MTLETMTAVMTEAMKTAIQSVQPKNIQTMSAEAFQSVEWPKPPIPTFQNGMTINLSGVKPPERLEKALSQLGEIPSGKYLDGVVSVTRQEPAHNTEGRLDIRYDHSTTEKRMVYSSMVHDLPDMIDQLWREAQRARK
jgi:hypothetical protein